MRVHASFSLVFKLRQMGISTSLHRHRKLSRSLFSSSSTTVTSGARSETTPRSSGRKGCGPSWAKKEANFRKLCRSVALAVSGNRQRGTAPLQTPGGYSKNSWRMPLDLLEPSTPHSCCPYGPCRERRWSRRAGRRWWAGGWPDWRILAASDEEAPWAGQWEWNWEAAVGEPARVQGSWRCNCRVGGR